MELSVVEMYEGMEQSDEKRFTPLTPSKNRLQFISQSYIFPQGVSAMAVTTTELGLTTRSVVVALPWGGVIELSKRILDARRPLDPTPEHREEMILPYMPEIPIATEDMLNYNQTVALTHGIKTSSSGLESTSLVLIYGLDMFYTRLTPSGTFDILKDDFDFGLISAVVVALIAGSVIFKKLARRHGLSQAWT